MDNKETVTIDISDVNGLIGKNLPDPDLLEFYKCQARREIIINYEIEDSLCTIGNMIIDWNREDKGIEPEKRKPIKIYINSNGGDADSTFYMTDIIKASKTPVYTIGMGHCFSAGGFLLMAGHKRFIFKNTTLLIHDGYTNDVGSVGKFLDSADFLKKQEDNILSFITEHTKITLKTAKASYRKDWFMFSDDIIKYGCADKIITSIDEVI